jgi:hypothetical protein
MRRPRRCDHAELLGPVDRDLDGADRDVGAALGVLGEHQAVVHLVNVVAGQDQYVHGLAARQVLQVLVHGVGRALVPGGVDLLLRRQDVNELAELAAEIAPGALQVHDQVVRLVLGQHRDAADAGIDAVGQGEIDDPVLAAERRRRLGSRQRQPLEARAATAGENQRDGVPGQAADIAAGLLGPHDSPLSLLRDPYHSSPACNHHDASPPRPGGCAKLRRSPFSRAPCRSNSRSCSSSPKPGRWSRPAGWPTWSRRWRRPCTVEGYDVRILLPGYRDVEAAFGGKPVGRAFEALPGLDRVRLIRGKLPAVRHPHLAVALPEPVRPAGRPLRRRTRPRLVGQQPALRHALQGGLDVRLRSRAGRLEGRHPARPRLARRASRPPTRASTRPRPPAPCSPIHNLAYQGNFDRKVRACSASARWPSTWTGWSSTGT